MKRFFALASIAAVAATMVSASPASADDCGATVIDAAGVAYVVVDTALLPDDVSIWIYQESNGDPGVQRGDENCSGTGTADTILL